MNLLPWDEQIYLLQYYIRTNHEKIQKLIDIKDRESLRKSLKEILNEEFDVTDSKALDDIMNHLLA